MEIALQCTVLKNNSMTIFYKKQYSYSSCSDINISAWVNRLLRFHSKLHKAVFESHDRIDSLWNAKGKWSQKKTFLSLVLMY